MKILIDINHPAQVHLFKNVYSEWVDRGDEVCVLARDKEITFELLEHFNIEFVPISESKKGLFFYPWAVLKSDWKVYKAARAFGPDFLLGTSFAAAHISKIVRGKSIVIAEDDYASSKLFWMISAPFADFVITPNTIKEDLGRRHIKYAGCQEMAYLHPSRFEADWTVLDRLGINKKEKFSIVRFVSLSASHDIGQAGIGVEMGKKIVDQLSKYGRVFISSERELDGDLEGMRLKSSPEDIHHVLRFAQILVSDSQSMTLEAAVLGTPSVRINTFVGRIPVIEDIEARYGLTFGILPENENEIFSVINRIMNDPNSKQEFEKKVKKYLSEQVDLTKWIVETIDKLHEGQSKG